MKQNLVITLKEKYIDNTNEIADQLKADGLEIVKVFSSGIIIGYAPSQKVVSKVLMHKEIEGTPTSEKMVNIAPPDSEVQ